MPRLRIDLKAYLQSTRSKFVLCQERCMYNYVEYNNSSWTSSPVVCVNIYVKYVKGTSLTRLLSLPPESPVLIPDSRMML